MRNIILFDDPEQRQQLLPITFTRPMGDLRLGIMTIREKWEYYLPGEYSYSTADYLSVKYPVKEADTNTDLYISGNVCPTRGIAEAVDALRTGERIVLSDGTPVAWRGKTPSVDITVTEAPLIVRTLPELFMLDGDAVEADFRCITTGRQSQPLSTTNTVIGDPFYPDGTPKIFLEPGAWVEGVILNVTAGPIYVGADAEIMEGSCVRAPLALCHHSHINMATRVYGPTTIGPWCKVGGEINNVVMIGYSNKGHDGFLGNAVIGEWCNLGADCVASNLKNDYSEIKLWNYPAHRFLRTGLQFCGLIMGDHTKAGINTMFNTATVVGVGCNIHGSGFPRAFIPSFSESSAGGYTDVALSKFFDIARRVMARRHVELTQADIDMFEAIYAIADTYK